jgi:GxxExxY protein
MNEDLQHRELTEKIIGLFYDVYNELGFGFLESVYEEAMGIALTDAGLKIQRQYPVPVWFRGRQIGDFKADLLVEEKIILELKAARSMDLAYEKQLLNYLRGTRLEVGLLLNFGPRAEFRRLAFSNERKSIRVYPRASAAKIIS